MSDPGSPIDLDSLSEPTRAYINECAALLSERLGDFGIALPEDGVDEMVADWLSESRLPGEDIDDIAARLTTDDVATEIATHLLAQIAEERPGTDPFAHDATIPLPLPVASRLINSLTVCTEIALINNDLDRTHGLVAACCAVSGILTHALVEGELVESPVQLAHEGNEYEFPGPLVMFPQPGLAYCARMIAGTAENLEDQIYDVAIDDPDGEERERFIHALLSDAQGIRLFTQQFGVDPNPSNGS